MLGGKRFLPIAAFVFLLIPAAACCLGEETDQLDWTTWQQMPVFHHGRMMPVNTFARVAVQRICHRAAPRLSLEGVDSADEQSAEFSGAKKIFPHGRRKFSAAELLFSWTVEPEAWEVVPFLLAEHEGLRREVFGLPIVGTDGKRLKYVSPRQVEHSDKFRQRLMSVMGKRRSAADGRKAKLTRLDQKVEQLYGAYTLYRALTFDPCRDQPTRLGGKLQAAAATWREASTTWNQLQADVARFESVGYEPSPGDTLEQIRLQLQQVGSSRFADLAELSENEARLVGLRQQALELNRASEAGKNELFAAAAPAGMSEAAVKRVRAAAQALASQAGDLLEQIEGAQLAVYDNGDSLRLVPGLNPPALEKNRLPDDDAQPWLNLQTLLLAGDDVFRGYARPNLPPWKEPKLDPPPADRLGLLKALAAKGNPQRKVRIALAHAAEAYLDRGGADRPARFSAAMQGFASRVRELGESLGNARRNLPLRQRDEELLAATAYPPPGATEAEVRYYRLDPFLWSWVFSLLALGCFALAFGVIRKPMFWAGIVVLIVGQVLAVYGFGLRVYITGWAPVTNMFETVAFVAVVVALLGLWFALWPLFGPGLRGAWRLTAIPGTPEAGVLRDEQAALFGPATWTTAGALLALPRLVLVGAIVHVLAGVSYGTGGGYALVRLVPRSTSPNDLVVWLVGLAMLGVASWLVPRLVLTALLSVITLPRSLAVSGLARPLAGCLGRKPFALVGALGAWMAGILAYFAPLWGLWDKDINPLMPVLRDNFWLTMHVLTITASYAAGLLAWGLGVIALGYYTLGRYRDPVAPPPSAVARGHRPAGGYHAPSTAFHRRAPEACARLASFTYKAVQVAVLLLAAGTILGGLWADVSWGRFWGWDSKEVWALISLLVYLAVLHSRFAGVRKDFVLAAGSVLGVSSIIMAWWGVNFFLGSGLHSYAEGAGGGGWVFGFMGLNAVFAVLAGVRYLLETTPMVTPVAAPETPPRTPPKTETADPVLLKEAADA